MLDDVVLRLGLAGLEGHDNLSVDRLAAPEQVRDKLVSALASDHLSTRSRTSASWPRSW